MEINNKGIIFLINMAKTQAILNARFDRGLGGLSFSEFLILYYLGKSKDKKMRRVDIANKIGLTASGVTRILLPMEKIHLIKSGSIEDDARVRFVQITSAGKEKLTDAMERLIFFIEEIIPSSKFKDIESLSDLLIEVGGRALMI